MDGSVWRVMLKRGYGDESGIKQDWVGLEYGWLGGMDKGMSGMRRGLCTHVMLAWPGWEEMLWVGLAKTGVVAGYGMPWARVRWFTLSRARFEGRFRYPGCPYVWLIIVSFLVQNVFSLTLLRSLATVPRYSIFGHSLCHLLAGLCPA